MQPQSGNTRKERLAAALKENLKRRKLQARARGGHPRETEAGPNAGAEGALDGSPNAASKAGQSP